MNAQATPIPTAGSSRRGFLGLASAGVGAAVIGHAGRSAAPAGASVAVASVAAADEELGYAESTVEVVTKTSAGIPNLLVRVAASDGPMVVEYASYVMSSAANGLVKLYLFRNGIPIHEMGCTVAGANGVAFLHGTKRVASFAGEATYGLVIGNWTTGATVRALGMPLSPTFLQIRLV